jgi:hypothetical protein
MAVNAGGNTGQDEDLEENQHGKKPRKELSCRVWTITP